MYNFDTIIDRKPTSCCKHSVLAENHMSEDTLAMWVADMDFETAPEIKTRLEAAVAHGIFGYMAQKDDYYEAVCGWFKRRFNWTVDKDSIVITPGVVFALAQAVRAFTEKGDHILIQRPVYYPFSNVIEGNDRVIVNNPLVLNGNRYEIDFEDMEQKITENDVKMFIMCSPHNPVSRVWSKEELKKAGEICKRHNVLMVVDEIHGDLIIGDAVQTAFGTLTEYADNAIICTAPSKTFNLAGLQLSNIVIANPELKKRYADEVIHGGFHGPNMFGQYACQAAYNEGEAWLSELLEYLKGNAAFVGNFVKEQMPKVKMIQPEGTYLLWLDFRAYGLSARELQDKMRYEAKIWLDEGDMFGEEGAGFMRVNIACPRSIVEEAMHRMKECFK